MLGAHTKLPELVGGQNRFVRAKFAASSDDESGKCIGLLANDSELNGGLLPES